ncbi:FAD-dependent oxidoreductase [Caballeronia sp. LZ001]|uniref:NAD(P)/FAD-dependent oxidoreductase n=1 Tax=Caballeronia sp. LZ001 TaxID=3038553 RepID=UPI0028583A2F|nr:FAD-dependent oxidoreductase [Caballeronia sp. LZ001]MDR5804868.1 FAD-dependent oxidoreductase [Caballeronia sp. LZ001]
MSLNLASGADRHVLIVGAGHAGVSVASLLRQYGHTGRITVVDAEAGLPVQRPPLSKAYLKGNAEPAAILIKPASFFDAQRIDFRPSTCVTRLYPERNSVALGAELVRYDALVLAMGVTPRRLPSGCASAANVFELRTMADADTLKTAIGPNQHIVIVGGGYVGLEVAASARAMGTQVTLVERESRLLPRVASEQLSAYFLNVHHQHGVHVLLNSEIEHVDTGSLGTVCGISLRSGQHVACDAVLVGIGAIPNDKLARSVGIVCNNRGIVVDSQAHTSVSNIYAVGDVTCRPVNLYGGLQMRLESIQSATEQARQVVHSLMGKPPAEPEVPWFWSDQYDLKLQIAGIVAESDTTIVRGDTHGGRAAFFHLRDSRVVAVEAINSASEFMAAKQMIKASCPVDPIALADSGVSLKNLISVSTPNK